MLQLSASKSPTVAASLVSRDVISPVTVRTSVKCVRQMKGNMRTRPNMYRKYLYNGGPQRYLSGESRRRQSPDAEFWQIGVDEFAYAYAGYTTPMSHRARHPQMHCRKKILLERGNRLQGNDDKRSTANYFAMRTNRELTIFYQLPSRAICVDSLSPNVTRFNCEILNMLV